MDWENEFEQSTKRPRKNRALTIEMDCTLINAISYGKDIPFQSNSYKKEVLNILEIIKNYGVPSWFGDPLEKDYTLRDLVLNRKLWLFKTIILIQEQL